MASNFKLFLNKNKDSIQMKMCGDFDGTSAYELIAAIKSQVSKSNHLYIHTGELNTIYSFGREVFHNNFRLAKKQQDKIEFVGKHQRSFHL